MIQQQTIDRIIDTAQIVDVVSDFVSLRRRGTNYIGLCPFHNEKTPSFSVSPTKNICHCFGCGKGGSPINFIMEHEQMTYIEAIRYLAKKYHIEVQETEESEEFKKAQSQREALFAANDLALNFFEDQLWNSQAGNDIGLAYFRQRGFTDAAIKKFRLGYSPEFSKAFYNYATKKGYNRDILFEAGLCIDDKNGGGYDRYRGRLIFPIFNIVGRTVGFGGRTMKAGDAAKYVNSPESVIYNKRNILYGLFQAKKAIAKQQKCYIVEGYADVISMHQAGFENVIASSGTALTDGHIHTLHRFCNQATAFFDGDSAGVHAALRSIDLLLREGLTVKVLTLPPEEDPDSFAQGHSTEQIEAYIAEHEKDFLQYKYEHLLQGTNNDPQMRSEGIRSIVTSLAHIPDSILRREYIRACSSLVQMPENLITAEVAKQIEIILQEERKQAENEKRRQQFGDTSEIDTVSVAPDINTQRPSSPDQKHTHVQNPNARLLYPYERDVIRYIAKFGMAPLCISPDQDSAATELNVLEFINQELKQDGIEFSNPAFVAIYQYANQERQAFKQAYEQECSEADADLKNDYHAGIENIRKSIESLADAEIEEEKLKQQLGEKKSFRLRNFAITWLEKKLISHPDDHIRQNANTLVNNKHVLSKIHSDFTSQFSEAERLDTLIPEALNNWKDALILLQIKELKQELNLQPTAERELEILAELQTLYSIRYELAKILGERVINPIK